jgi:hypothetical protein
MKSVVFAYRTALAISLVGSSLTACADAGSGDKGDAGDAGGVQGPCAAAGACLARFTLPGTSYQLPYYSSSPLSPGDPHIAQAVVFNEGLDRDAANDFTTMLEAAQMAGHLTDTLILTPNFEALVETDGGPCGGNPVPPAPHDLIWTCDAWSDGLASMNDPNITSYGALDALLAAVEQAFPGLEQITVSGFSAGGQFTQRYAAANKVDRGTEGVSFRYVVGSPSSYLYFDERRPVNASSCTFTGCPDGFAPYAGAEECPDYNDWKYGTGDLEGAASDFTAAELKEAYIGRNIRYLLGSLDDGPTDVADYSELDVTCPAEAEGPFRLQRGQAFFVYVTGALGAGKQRASVVPGCGHNPPCVFESAVGLSAVFGE